MGFGQAISSAFSNYFNFRDRASRPAYWWFALFCFLILVIAEIADVATIGQQSLFTAIALLALIVPSLAVGARRLHDTGHTGWWQLINLIPLIGVIVLIIFFCQPTDPDPNKYGDPPAM
jgi:uncharacterized membrane protein YhaH (DUF805 family)